jgi:hypothetical protein
LIGRQGYCKSKAKTKLIVMYLSCILKEKQGYLESKNIFYYEASLMYGKSLG